MRGSATSGAFHESFSRAESKHPTNRSFGLTFAGLFLALGLLPLARGDGMRIWALALSGALLVIGLVAPSLLGMPNRLWMSLGRRINRVLSPIVLGLFFYAIFTPFATILRWAGRDVLGRRLEQESETYFVDRSASSAGPLGKQF
jgi:hypothetical protein